MRVAILIALYSASLCHAQRLDISSVQGPCIDNDIVRFDASVSGFRCKTPVTPSGTILIILTSTCPTGYTEVAGLNGFMLRGTVAANGDVNTTAGSDTMTPTGSVAAPTFTGNSGVVPAETIAWPVGVPTFAGTPGTVPAEVFTGSSATTSSVSAGTPAGTNGTVSITPLGTNAATATSGNCAATNLAIGTGALTACKATAPNLTVPAETFTGSSTTVGAETFTGSALGTHTHSLTATGTNATAAFTPAGTVAWPVGVPINGTVNFTPTGSNSAPTFTGNSFDNRPAYRKVIFCQRS